ncbi:MAG: hypothetical protein F6J89_26760 [Symploca sp. SIO1C4]|uniref:Uncharacterized protein n=1 Tax=Symploca sp. SIO1C4 TaxID=2607765 RepID=A0A6B3NHI1_9CYAN|nr:hypothetical protein [Symploca sp. SIO1C4]
MPIKAQPGYVRFLKWNGVIYNLDRKAPRGISPALKSSRYRGTDKSIIDAAIADLEKAEDGSWVFGKEKTWITMPLSVPEIQGIAEYDDTVYGQMQATTPVIPLFPNHLKAYRQEVKEILE